MVQSIRRFARRNQMLAGIIIGVLININMQVHHASATANPLTQIMSPAGTLTTLANTIKNVPKPAGYTGTYCSVAIWNNSAEPLYWGGPIGTVGAATVAGGMPICTNTALCRDSWVTLDTAAVAVISANAIGAGNIRYVFGTGC